MKFNVNNYVKVRLTDEGRTIIKCKRYSNPLLKGYLDYDDTYPKEDENGWSMWQMWDLMSMFGDYMYNGCRIPFETEIEIIEK
jgi:hypothetical protein